VALGIGVIGIPLPILPTTPFLLAAAYCYARGSRRCHDWLVHHRLLGAFLVSSEVGMPRWLKAAMIAFVWAACAISFVLFAKEQWQQLVLLVVGCVMTAYLVLARGAPRAVNEGPVGVGSDAKSEEKGP
jgi:uncharacterized membrane protein YbaN (DUF454 family)